MKILSDKEPLEVSLAPMEFNTLKNLSKNLENNLKYVHINGIINHKLDTLLELLQPTDKIMVDIDDLSNLIDGFSNYIESLEDVDDTEVKNISDEIKMFGEKYMKPALKREAEAELRRIFTEEVFE